MYSKVEVCLKKGDRVRKLKGQLRVFSTGEITGEMTLIDGTKFVHVKYPEWTVPILEFASDLGLEPLEGLVNEINDFTPVQLSLF